MIGESVTGETVIGELLPAAVVAVEAFDDPPGADLFPAEEAVIARSVDKRRREFTTVRFCARRALGRLGVAPVPILPGPKGAPGWPAGIVGSMTHCANYRAAAVAPRDRIATIGIDAEPNEPLPKGVLEAISLPEEREWLALMAPRSPAVHWERLLFSAKESVYKAWFPLTGRWLDFSEASVTVEPATGRFTARLLVPGPVVAGTPIDAFPGRWLVRRGLVVTTIVIPAAAS